VKKILVLLLLFAAGCTTITGYHKKVTIEKDGEGKIIRTVIEEEVTQPNLQSKVREFKHLDE